MTTPAAHEEERGSAPSLDGDDSDGYETPLLPTDSQPTHSKKDADAVYRLISWRLLPLSFALATLCVVNGTNISFAQIGMSTDIGISKSEFGTASGLYFATYMIFKVPSNAVLERVGPPTWLGVILIGWGLVSSATGLISNAAQLYILRLLLGMFQAGAIPGVICYLSGFFPNSRMGVAFGFVNCGAMVGNGFLAPLCAGFLSMDGVLQIRGWRWMLFLQGIPSMLVGVAMMFSPKTPGSFLTKQQHLILKRDKGELVKKRTPMHRNIPYLWKTVVLNCNIWLMLLAAILVSAVRVTAMFWTPLWIDAMTDGSGLDWGKSETSSKSEDGVRVALLSGIPYALAAVASWFFAWTAERLNDRTFHMATLRFTGGLAFVLIPWLAGENVVLGFVALMVGHIGANGATAISLSLILSFLTDENKSFGIAWVNSLASLGGLFGPTVAGFLADASGSYKSAIWGIGAMCMLGGILTLFLPDSVREEARKKRQRSTTP